MHAEITIIQYGAEKLTSKVLIVKAMCDNGFWLFQNDGLLGRKPLFLTEKRDWWKIVEAARKAEEAARKAAWKEVLWKTVVKEAALEALNFGTACSTRYNLTNTIIALFMFSFSVCVSAYKAIWSDKQGVLLYLKLFFCHLHSSVGESLSYWWWY